jgi:hypothetical protein
MIDPQELEEVFPPAPGVEPPKVESPKVESPKRPKRKRTKRSPEAAAKAAAKATEHEGPKPEPKPAPVTIWFQVERWMQFGIPQITGVPDWEAARAEKARVVARHAGQWRCERCRQVAVAFCYVTELGGPLLCRSCYDRARGVRPQDLAIDDILTGGGGTDYGDQEQASADAH